MKKLTGSLAAKTAAVILSFITAFICVISTLSVILMASGGFYVKSLDEIKDKIYDDKLYGYSSEIYDAFISGEDIAKLCEKRSVSCKITDSDTDEILFDNTSGAAPAAETEQKNMEIYDEVYTKVGESPVYIEGVTQSIDIAVYAYEDFPLSDNARMKLRICETAYSCRYLLIAAAIISALAFVCLFVFLCAAAGHRADGSIRRNYLDKVPFDLLLASAFFAVILTIMIIGDTYGSFMLMFAVTAGLLSVDYFIALAVILSFAARLKTKTLLKNNIIYMVLSIIGKGFKKLFRFAGFIFKNLSLVKKTVLICAAVLVFDFFATLFCGAVQVYGLFMILVIFNAIAVTVIVIFTAIQLQRIKKGGERIADGDIDYKIDTAYMYPEFKSFCASLNNISRGMQNAVNEKMKSERMRTELITNVSHDIKTPLTSIINYVDLIKKEEPENEKIKEYIGVLDRQSVRLKKLIEDLVEASKASTGNLTVNLAECEAGVLLSQTVGEFDERLKNAGLTPVLNIPEEPVKIMADGRHLWRVFENLTGNVCKYSMPGTRVYMELVKRDGKAVITFKNISKYELNISGEELMERFVRGDKSRNTEGSGLGLSIARSLTELQRGEMRIEVDGDLFKVTLTFDAV